VIELLLERLGELDGRAVPRRDDDAVDIVIVIDGGYHPGDGDLVREIIDQCRATG
jgi:hypothetical protein